MLRRVTIKPLWCSNQKANISDNEARAAQRVTFVSKRVVVWQSRIIYDAGLHCNVLFYNALASGDAQIPLQSD